jgi:hypothetical protein
MLAPVGAPGVLGGAAGLKGALYTGRGPVCGTIIRGGGTVDGGGALGTAGLAAMVGTCGTDAVVRRVVTTSVPQPAELRVVAQSVPLEPRIEEERAVPEP